MDFVNNNWDFITSILLPIIESIALLIPLLLFCNLNKKTEEGEFNSFLKKCNSDEVDKINIYLDQERENGRLYKYWKQLYQVDYTSLFAAITLSIAIIAFALPLFEAPATTKTSTQENTAIASTQESSVVASTRESSTELQEEKGWTLLDTISRGVAGVRLLLIICLIVALAVLPAKMEERMGKIRVAKEVLNIYIEKGSVSEIFNKSEIRGKEGFLLSFENTPNRTYEINIKDSLVCPERDSKEKALENKEKVVENKDGSTMELRDNKMKDTQKQDTSKKD